MGAGQDGHRFPPCYYIEDNGVYLPTGLARSPWDRAAIAGGPVSALLATGAEDPALDADFEIARFSVDIFGKVPHAPLTLRSDCLRDGRQTKLHRITMLAGDRPAAQAHVLRVRRTETPVIPVPHDYPMPDTIVENDDTPPSAAMAGAIRTRRVLGGPGRVGRGVCWLRMDGEIVAGRAPSNFTKAAIFADFGNGYGAATDAREWSFANLDITVQFLRMPVGDWFLLDAETHMAGNGHGTARNILADELGVFARGFQTIFVAPGHLSKSLPQRVTAVEAEAG
ncbi:thioesterase family protein [Novosphingobium sp. KCTC 2891]|uniref:thioesterase family protein n=1 Tax=Novosphingobium sp. KCTC 2891 TaxID=2989730 RepID=UPI0022214830|nr:thioesterase family protein [Novosphingobium sp. KCTC 2891]MCW1382722.1 thioesterase family protein [Novosphingobium sp. KCTC 2891]